MKNIFTILLGLSLSFLSAQAADKVEKENNIAKSIEDLSIPAGIIDVYKDTKENVTVYIGGRGSATANLVKISKVKAKDHALRIAEQTANKAFAEFIQKNVEAFLSAKETITDSSLDIDGLMKKMETVTENKQLAGKLRPEDQAEIVKAVLETIITNIRNSSGVQSVSTLEVRQRATQTIRGMSLFGSHVGSEGDEIVAVEVFKWSPSAASFAAQAEGHNNQKAVSPEKGAEILMNAGKNKNVPGKPFISRADDF
jgi:hypothetical protein